MTLSRGLWMAALIMMATAGCTSTRVARQETPPDVQVAATLAKPEVVLVYDFAATPKEFLGDMLGPDVDCESAEPSESDELGRRAAAAISERLVERLKSRGIPAKRAGDFEAYPLHAIVIKGQIMSVDPGSRVRRVVLGLGQGRSEMIAHVQTYQFTRWGLLRIEQAEAIALGPRTLGMAGPIGIAAAVGSAGTSAIVSGGLNLVGELRGGVDACARRIADGIVQDVVALYERQGWR